MPFLSFISVDEANWKTSDPDTWDGKSFVWFNNKLTGESIKIPLISTDRPFFSKDTYMVPSYALLNNVIVNPEYGEQTPDFERYVGYVRFNQKSGFGVGMYHAYSGSTTVYNSSFYINFNDSTCGTWNRSGAPQMPSSIWETNGAIFLCAYKDESQDSVDGYSIIIAGPKYFDGDEFLSTYYSPTYSKVPFSDVNKFPDGSDGITITETEPIYDPFGPGGESGVGGGGGDFDNTSTPIEIPGLPTVSAASTGFISLFNPTLSQLNELASYMWSDVFDIDTLKKLFADPMDVILGLSILPVQIPTSGAREVKVGNIGTGISLNVASTQFVEVDCGTINVNEYWGAYLDYSPYTHAQIYLPYVGVRPISVDEIMGKSVNVKYHVDILTGACCCFVKCGESVLYSFNGQCSIPIPISATNYTNTINGIISVAASLGTMVATGGATAPFALTNLASTVANQMKPTVEKSGAISGPGGVMGIQTPYLILTRPRQALPSKQNEFTGYPSFITLTLGELSGYTEVHSIHLENIPATADELSEIETLLKGGVIF